ncbi:MAG: glutaredoxin family protein [Rivularia sp. ALOHA_DT_140]|nr:glutaredoxin family protein [Rivularia sp. ALOHA_DT_140]
MKLILYSKPGCHLCEGLQEKLETILQAADFASLDLEVRDITNREDWFAAYQYEVPVLYVAKDDNLQTIPRPSPRASVVQLEKTLRKYI